jgi:hypothetical protein
MNAIQTPAQTTLDGMAPPPRIDVMAALDAGHPLKFYAIGQLLANATVRQNSHGQVLLEVLIEQQIDHHPHALPLFAAQAIDQGNLVDSLDHARQLAARLTAGTEVLAIGRGLETGKHCGTQVLRLIHTISVRRTDVLANQIQQAENANAH